MDPTNVDDLETAQLKSSTSPDAPVIPPEVEKSEAAGRTEKSLV